MKNPPAIAIASVGGAIATSGGSIMGIPIEALIAGLFGGLAALLVMPAPPERLGGARLYLAIAGSVALSVIVAGFLGPWTAEWIDAPSVDDRTELLGASFLWGAGAQAGLLVTAIDALRRRISQLGGAP